MDDDKFENSSNKTNWGVIPPSPIGLVILGGKDFLFLTVILHISFLEGVDKVTAGTSPMTTMYTIRLNEGGPCRIITIQYAKKQNRNYCSKNG